MKYGLFELNNNQPIGVNMADENRVKEAREGAVCPPQVTELVAHLKSTGTGQAKLDKLTELGGLTKNLDEFLKMCPANVPAATMKKIEDYIAQQVVTPEAKKAMKEDWAKTEKGKEIKDKFKKRAEGGIESRSQDQSSIPEYTIIQQNKAPVLQEAGSSQSKQLGSDVIPDDSDEDDEEGEEGTEGTEAKSPLADLPADEAKDKISRMTSIPRLEATAANDKRVTVQEAAQKRLDELNKAE